MYNNKVCVRADDLIAFDDKTGIGSRDGFISLSAYKAMGHRNQLVIARRGNRNTPALIEFETMRPDIKNKYVETYGDPRASLANRSSRQYNLLTDYIAYDNAAYTFFSSYRYGDNALRPEKVDEYTLSASIIEAILKLRQEHKSRQVGKGSTRIPFWENIGKIVNDLATLKDAKGLTLFPHKLPSSWKSLKRKCEAFSKGMNTGMETAYKTLIHKNYANNNASIVTTDVDVALLRRMFGLHTNLNNMQVMKAYNEIAARRNVKAIKSPITVARYRQQWETLTLTQSRGRGVWNSGLKKQITRKAPETPFTLLCFDGWEVELMYDKTEVIQREVDGRMITDKKITSFHRKTIVVILDTCCKYPVGYAIGDHENNGLIKEALRNAIKHAQSLFGKRYMPCQLQCDNYHKSSLFDYYRAICEILTPAAVGNAQSKIIERYFHYLITEYFQMYPTFAGFGITSDKKIQPNAAWLNDHRKLHISEEKCISIIKEVIEKDRAKKIGAYMKAWSNTPADRKILFPDAQYLHLMGVRKQLTNKIQPDAFYFTLDGKRYQYESFDLSVVNHRNEEWITYYDPEDMSKVLISNCGRKGTKDEGKEIGNLQYIMETKRVVPMALKDQTEEDFAYRKRVDGYNRELKGKIMDGMKGDIDVLQQQSCNPILAMHGTVLDRFVFTDSKGQHKDERSRLREFPVDTDAEVITETNPPVQPTKEKETLRITHDDPDVDYEFNPATDMRYSR